MLTQLRLIVATCILSMNTNATLIAEDYNFISVKEKVDHSLAIQMSQQEHVQQDWETEQFDELRNHRLISKVLYRTRQKDGLFLYESVVQTPPPTDIKVGLKPRTRSLVLGSNTHYAFELNSNAGIQNWRLKRLHNVGSSDGRPKALTPSSLSRSTRSARPFETGRGLLLTELFSDSSFRLISCGASPENPALVRVSFVDSPPSDPKRPPSRSEGWYDLDPRIGWSVSELHESSKYGTTTTVIHTKLTSVLVPENGLVALREVRSVVKLMRDENDLVSHLVSVSKYKTWSDSHVPEQEFYLSAYDLPEPVGIERERPTPRYVWFAVVAGLLLVLALSFRALARRRSAAVPS